MRKIVKKVLFQQGNFTSGAEVVELKNVFNKLHVYLDKSFVRLCNKIRTGIFTERKY